jgi:hypothetical protein
MNPLSKHRMIALACAAMMSGLCLFAEPIAPDQDKVATIKALQEFNLLVGNWRGIGQPKRGSQVGAWQERAESVWELKPQSNGIRWNIDAGKYWKTALLSFDESTKKYQLSAKLLDDSTRTYRGELAEQRLVMDSEPDEKKDVHRITLTVLNENRVTLLFERRAAEQSFLNRVAEIAYQREGTRLAVAGSSGHECVVTGGLGTIAVTHNGKTYYVCCTGCRDAFKEDPEGILAEYAKRKAAEKDKK